MGRSSSERLRKSFGKSRASGRADVKEIRWD